MSYGSARFSYGSLDGRLMCLVYDYNRVYLRDVFIVTGWGSSAAPVHKASGGRGLDRLLVAAAAITTALTAGVFFDFSFVIMPGLRELPAAQGIEAMQAFNRTAVTPPLMLLMFGTAALCVVVMVRAVMKWDRWSSPLILAAVAAFLLAVVLITGGANVPVSAKVDALVPSAADSAARWDDLFTQWVWWNHARVLTSVAAAVGFIAALRHSVRSS
ncbi:anthrone oxygenase family protein [Nocardia altamirensis]|uniref:anthrone oxygenase family protein n=1 Tax=Nocardia altamirensis TaxID=472158 RepID=UPI001FE1111C|nr:anthrone oxygenase family protein [Nocardia altamirensis]